MKSSKYAISAYRSATLTAPPLVTVVMCYDDILNRLANAARAGLAGQFEAQHKEIYRATLVLTGLASGVDLEKGGEVAERLADLYNTLIKTLNHFVAKRNAPEQYRKIAESLLETRNAWAEIAGMAPRELQQQSWVLDQGPSGATEPDATVASAG